MTAMSQYIQVTEGGGLVGSQLATVLRKESVVGLTEAPGLSLLPTTPQAM